MLYKLLDSTYRIKQFDLQKTIRNGESMDIAQETDQKKPIQETICRPAVHEMIPVLMNQTNALVK